MNRQPIFLFDSHQTHNLPLALMASNNILYSVRCNGTIAPISVLDQSLIVGAEIPDNLPDGFMFFNSNKKTPLWSYKGKFFDSFGIEKDTIKVGSTAQRPTNVPSGFQYFDTSLKKPIWWDGEKWVDSVGTTV